MSYVHVLHADVGVMYTESTSISRYKEVLVLVV